MNEQLVRRVRAAFEALATGDASVFTAMLADNVVYNVIGNTRFSGRFAGGNEVFTRLFLPLTGQLAAPLQIEPLSIFGQENIVAVQARGRARFRSGPRYDNEYCFVFHFRRDQVSEVFEYLDTHLLARALTVPPDEERLLRAMDHNMGEMFRENTRLARGGELIENRSYWMGYSPRGVEFHNMIMVKEAIGADDLLEAARHFYGPRQKRFSICLRQHVDSGLEEALRGRGFKAYSTMPGMVLFNDLAPIPPPLGIDLRPVIDDRARREFVDVVAEAYSVYGAPREFAEDAFSSLESLCAPHIQAFVAYLRGEPVAAASLYLTHGAAGVGWVATLSGHRRKGYGEAVTAAVVREGFRRGAGFANLQASPMGEKVYQRMGFAARTEYRVVVPPDEA